MKEVYYLAAEFYGYSYEHYYQKLQIRHIRFTKYMADDMRILERDFNNPMDDQTLADLLESDIEKIPDYREKYRISRAIVKSDSVVNQLKNSLKISIEDAIEKGLDTEEAIDHLVGQIGYRIADFHFVLKDENLKVDDYLDEIKGFDTEWIL